MLKLIIYIVIAVLILSAFGISLHSLVTAPQTQQNFAYLWQIIVNGFNYVVAQLHALGINV